MKTLSVVIVIILNVGLFCTSLVESNDQLSTITLSILFAISTINTFFCLNENKISDFPVTTQEHIFDTEFFYDRDNQKIIRVKTWAPNILSETLLFYFSPIQVALFIYYPQTGKFSILILFEIAILILLTMWQLKNSFDREMEANQKVCAELAQITKTIPDPTFAKDSKFLNLQPC
eukprot:TRINITY_DN994_c1_g6_i1.p1 TRINITY_DN994_c1_g6~~TRINITY_DN994_c1_g6_i1.p1  ORF type:complete len:176 (-),score=48.24 TRINITY_DN994_c1_g6_i1:134-661(-)